MSKYTVLGKVVNAHGIKGTIKVYPYTEHLEQFVPGQVLYLGEDHQAFVLESSRIQKNILYLKLREINTRTEAEMVKDCLLSIESKKRRNLKENEYFIEDLIGFDVFDDQMQKIGQLKDVVKGAANDVFRVSDGKTIWNIPVVKAFVLEVNQEDQFIQVHLIEGMEEWKFLF